MQELVPKARIALIEEAYDYAERAHHDQLRENGDPFITHPAACAMKLAEMGLDTTTIVAGLLHDAVEDTEITVADIRKAFGDEVAHLVRACTKIKHKQPEEYKREDWQVQTLQRMFLAMAKDIRAVIVKLADRLHNMQTLGAKKDPASRKRIAQQTMDIYAPIANRLGIGELKGELEDLAFQHLYPKEYEWVERFAYKDREMRKELVSELQGKIQELLEGADIKLIRTDGRIKHKYSLYKKLQRYGRDLDQIYDLVALRILVPDEGSCYEALGIIHEHFKPIPGRIKDYIATPKPNGYRSLHTVVSIQPGVNVEFQIRTPQMHREAEFGVAAHWSYDEKKHFFANAKDKPHVSKKDLAWINQLSRWKYQVKDQDEYVESLKIDFFENRIYVRTPRGDIFDLPQGATPLDFAYRVHTEVGNKYVGAKINGHIVRMNYELQNDDVVEILTDKNSLGPKRKWVEFVKTSNARNKIRATLRTKDPEENRRIGHEILDKHYRVIAKMTAEKFFERLAESELNRFFSALGIDDLSDYYEHIGNGSITIDQANDKIRKRDPELLEKLHSIVEESFKQEQIHKPDKGSPKEIFVVVDNDESIISHKAKCCNPKAHDPIIGYITNKKGIMVHHENCANMSERRDESKVIPVSWVEKYKEQRLVRIRIVVERKTGVLRDLASEIANNKIGIVDIKAGLINPKQAIMDIQILVDSLKDLNEVFQSLESLEFVERVERY